MNKNNKDFKNTQASGGSRGTQSGSQLAAGQKNAEQYRPSVDRGQNAPSQSNQKTRWPMKIQADETSEENSWQDQSVGTAEEIPTAQERNRKNKRGAGFEEEDGVKEERDI